MAWYDYLLNASIKSAASAAVNDDSVSFSEMLNLLSGTPSETCHKYWPSEPPLGLLNIDNSIMKPSHHPPDFSHIRSVVVGADAKFTQSADFL